MAGKKAMCYGCGEKPARKDSRFCTQRCAAEHGESQTMDMIWCPKCEWILWDYTTEDSNGNVHCECGEFLTKLKIIDIDGA